MANIFLYLAGTLTVLIAIVHSYLGAVQVVGPSTAPSCQGMLEPALAPSVPPMAKVSALSWNGGTGAEPTVNSARSAQSRTATKPMAVAVRRWPRRLPVICCCEP